MFIRCRVSHMPLTIENGHRGWRHWEISEMLVLRIQVSNLYQLRLYTEHNNASLISIGDEKLSKLTECIFLLTLDEHRYMAYFNKNKAFVKYCDMIIKFMMGIVQ